MADQDIFPEDVQDALIGTSLFASSLQDDDVFDKIRTDFTDEHQVMMLLSSMAVLVGMFAAETSMTVDEIMDEIRLTVTS